MIKTIYKSADGKVFERKKDCLVHEALVSGTIQLYGAEGRVYELSKANVVILNNRVAAMCFITLCRREGHSTEGLDDSSVGVFVWCSEERCYFRLDPSAMLAIKAI